MAEERLPERQSEEESISQTDSSLGEEAEIPVLQEVLEKLPAEARRVIARSFSASTMVAGPMPNPILEKLTEEHISDLIETVDKDGDRALEDRKHSRKWLAIILVLVMFPIVGLLGYFAFLEQFDLALEILKLAGMAGGLFLGGIGFARWRQRQ